MCLYKIVHVLHEATSKQAMQRHPAAAGSVLYARCEKTNNIKKKGFLNAV